MEMKEIVLIFIASSLVTAHVATDWSKIITTHEAPHQHTSSEDIKIVGGLEAVPNSIPYQAALILFYKEETRLCGGSLITRRYVLTAGHCLVDELVSLYVILGAHKYGEDEPTQQIISTSTFKVHEQFDGGPLANDIGIVHLPTPANLNQYVQLIALPRRADVSKSFAGSEAVVSGWGRNSSNDNDVSNVLRYLNVPFCQTTCVT
ncbi:chymotrypsin BI-like [Agrilus planipennis]|uniref:Chymotrypsin BI-like n=1 Tax=Agrilus planipennis TaxID=224129 RepID=A0A7F5RJL7_AGRPL|nr:chymotrypsin BI-like [Agrilus planipennis]